MKAATLNCIIQVLGLLVSIATLAITAYYGH
jgi:hypothetical protein